MRLPTIIIFLNDTNRRYYWRFSTAPIVESSGPFDHFNEVLPDIVVTTGLKSFIIEIE